MSDVMYIAKYDKIYDITTAYLGSSRMRRKYKLGAEIRCL